MSDASTPAEQTWTAYCAPGLEVFARLALILQGEDVADVKPHPWLTGGDIVMVRVDIPLPHAWTEEKDAGAPP